MKFDIDAELKLLRQQQGYQSGAPAGRTLVKEEDLRVVLMALRAGGRLEEHSASGPVSVHALQGSLRLRLTGETVALAAGELLGLQHNVAHDVEAIEDCAFLLTIGRTKYHTFPAGDHEPGSS